MIIRIWWFGGESRRLIVFPRGKGALDGRDHPSDPFLEKKNHQGAQAFSGLLMEDFPLFWWMIRGISGGGGEGDDEID